MSLSSFSLVPMGRANRLASSSSHITYNDGADSLVAGTNVYSSSSQDQLETDSRAESRGLSCLHMSVNQSLTRTNQHQAKNSVSCSEGGPAPFAQTPTDSRRQRPVIKRTKTARGRRHGTRIKHLSLPAKKHNKQMQKISLVGPPNDL